MSRPESYAEGTVHPANLMLLKKESFHLFTVQMLMDPMGGIVMTNDGNAILREVGLKVHYLLACHFVGDDLV